MRGLCLGSNFRKIPFFSVKMPGIFSLGVVLRPSLWVLPWGRRASLSYVSDIGFGTKTGYVRSSRVRWQWWLCFISVGNKDQLVWSFNSTLFDSIITKAWDETFPFKIWELSVRSSSKQESLKMKLEKQMKENCWKKSSGVGFLDHWEHQIDSWRQGDCAY